MYSVLIVEDEELIRKELVISVDWESVDCRVIGEASDGIEGERLIRELSPDIVITDIRLPGKNGLDMLSDTDPGSAIVFSGYSEFALAQKALRLGAFDYLLKPVEQKNLLDTLRNLCQKLDLRQAGPEENRGEPGQEIHVRSAMDIIDSRFNEDISLDEIAEALGLSVSHLSHLFKVHSGYTVLGYLQDRRIRESMKLLADPSLNITEVYNRCGFTHGSYFSKIFKRYTGVTPSEFRNSR